MSRNAMRAGKTRQLQGELPIANCSLPIDKHGKLMFSPAIQWTMVDAQW
jgi:hypothetical protein